MSWWTAHSVRRRLTLWYVAAMIVVLAVYAAAVFSFVSHNLSQSLDQQLRRDFQWAAATVDQTREGDFTWAEPQDIAAEEDRPWVQVWSQDGQMVFRNSEAERRPIPETRDLALRAGTSADPPVVIPTPVAATRVLSRRGSIGPQPVVIQVARSEAAMRRSLRDLLLILVLGLPLAVALAGIGGYTLARRALAPVERMTDRARSITAERLSDRLPVAHPDDEMGRLATVFNETLGRLEASFEQMRQFTADVSHELRTPLTAIRSVGEVGLREHRGDAEYRSIIGSMLEEADRLASLVDRLLMLSRAETGQSKFSRDDVDLQALADEVAAHLGVLAEEKKQTLAIECLGTPHARADRLVLRQAVINLVDNAIKFSPVGGRVRMRVADGVRTVTLDVIDSGPGIDAEARTRIFDRFYRAATVTGAAPGTGLGLSIARGAVEANAGRLTLESAEPGACTFRVTLPRLDPRARLKAS
ncbi:MAG TPA: ATP-binding protein [Vicinamibacterales bacterium]